MAHSSHKGRPANYKNLSPFAGHEKRKDASGQGFLFIGVLGILASVALILRALVLGA